MENAAKALLIAGSVLIAILLLTLLSYLFTKMHEDTSKIQEQMTQNDILEFNQQFLLYDRIQDRIIGYRNNNHSDPIYGYLTAQDVATIINLAKENNERPKFPTTISVMYGGIDLVQTQNTLDWLKNNANTNRVYKCFVTINNNTSLVERVDITNY